MKVFTSRNQRIGESGEDIACLYLERRGFQIIERNYTKKWGELDIVAYKNDVVHFIEVKSVSSGNMMMRPEDQMYSRKTDKMKRMIELYVNGRALGKWQVDLACVYMDFAKRRARVKLWEDIIL